MGLALDEYENNTDNKLKENDINLVYDNTLKKFIENGSDVTVDYVNSPQGSGFTVSTGNSCGEGGCPESGSCC